MAKGRLPRVPWPPGLRLESLLALAASLLLLGLVALLSWMPGPAAADGPWQRPTCSPTPCTDVRDVAVAPAPTGGAAEFLAFLVGGAGRLWRSDDGGQSFRDIQTYLNQDLTSVSVVPGTWLSDTSVYVSINGDNHILSSRDGGLTFSQVKVGLPMEQRAVCGLGRDRAVVFGRVGTFPAAQWAGPNDSSGIEFTGVDFNDCDVFRNPFTGDPNGLKVGQGGFTGMFGFRGPNDPQYPGLFFTATGTLGGQLNDVDCENYVGDEIILALGERRTSAFTSAVCRAAGRDEEGKGVVLQLNLTGPSTLTYTVILRSDRPFQSVGFWGDYGAALRQDGMVYMTWDRGNTWQATASPTGSIPRRVAVLPWYIYGGTALGPRVALLGQDGVWYYELPTPDVAISKEGPAQVAAGGEVTYTLRITNTTPLTARGVTVADTISVDHGVAAAVPSPILRGGRSTFWLLGTLEGNESRTITYTVLLTDSLQAGASVTNRAEVTATGDLNPANNTAVVTATVQGGGGGGGRADMEATKAGPRTVVAGQPFTYTLLAVNVGTEKATGVMLTDTLPAELRFLGADFTPSLVLTPTVRWLAGEVQAGEVNRIAVRVELSGTVAAGTVLTNPLSVSSANDANPLNDRAQVTSTVASVASAPSSEPVSTTIGARGGTLTSQEGSYVVVVPRRVFSSPLTLSFQPQTPPAPSEGSIPVAAFSLSGTLGTATVTALDRPITVEVKYSDAGLTEVQERRLTLFRKTASGAFIALSTQVDTVNNIARATVDHLSDFVLQALDRFLYLPFLARAWPGGW